jgi:hypothetical protein
MSQPSQNPSSAPAAETRDPRIPRDVRHENGRICWQDLRGGEHSLTEEDYFFLLGLQQSAEADPSCAGNRQMRIPPHTALDRDGYVIWLNARRGECRLQEEGYQRLVELQQASGILPTATRPAPAGEPTSEPTPNPSRSREGSETCRGPDEGGGEVSRSGVGTGETGVPTQDWLARGLKHPAGRGWETDGPAIDAATPDRFESIRKFGLAARVRFLDALASHGEVRAAAARAGISHETAYRARRRYADFAQLWDAAMVHARTRAESELGTRALDGVEVPVIVRGEQVGAWRRHDARYLLAHLARLDRHVEANPAAVKRAERFDEMLAAMAGHELPEEFAETCPKEGGEGVPPTRADFITYAHAAVLTEREEDGEETYENEEEREAAEAEVMEWASEEAGAEHDLWVAGSFAKLDRVLEGQDECEDAGESEEAAADGAPGDVPLIEYKAIMPGSALRAKLRRSVSHVSTGGPPPFVIPAKAGTQLQSAPTGSPLSRG